MGNIVNDIVEEVDIKPNNTKRIIRIVVSVAIACIGVAFAFGQFKSSFFNRMDNLEEKMDNNKVAVEQVRTDLKTGFEKVNERIDKGYDDGLEALRDYQEFNKRQLILVLDYGQTNKELLKEMLEMNLQERTKTIENQMNQAKNEESQAFEPSISVTKATEFHDKTQTIEPETGDTIINVVGATIDYYNSIDKNKYEVGALTESARYPNRYNFAYRNK